MSCKPDWAEGRGESKRAARSSHLDIVARSSHLDIVAGGTLARLSVRTPTRC